MFFLPSTFLLKLDLKADTVDGVTVWRLTGTGTIPHRTLLNKIKKHMFMPGLFIFIGMDTQDFVNCLLFRKTLEFFDNKVI